MPETIAPKPAAARKRPSRWHLPIWWANGFAVLLLLASYLAPHVSPQAFWPLTLLAFGFPYLLLIHAGFLGYWLLFRRKRMLLSGVALLIGWGHVRDHVQLFGNDAPPTGVGEQVKVMSWNVRLFDLYNWDDNERSRDAIFEVLRREDAGILCLQEYFHSTHRRFFRTSEEITGAMGYREHAAWALTTRLDQHFGIATFSKRPIVGKGSVTFKRKSGNLCIWTDIALKRDTIRVYNAHLASLRFGDGDYGFIDSLQAGAGSETIKQGGGRLLKLLRDGATRRAEEVGAIVEHMRGSPHPMLFCGDINDVPMSYAYACLREGRKDAFVESGTGLGGTYIGKLPKLRIDYVLHDPALASWGFRRLPEELSDHHANTVMIGVREPQ